MSECTVTGIALKAFDLGEKKRILKIMTEEMGVVEVVVANIGARNPQLFQLTTPLTEGQYQIKKTRSNLYRFVEGVIVKVPLELRQNFSKMRAAGAMVKAVLDSQLTNHPSPMLFHLLRSYLNVLKDAPHPNTLLASFRLKNSLSRRLAGPRAKARGSWN